MKKPDPRIYQKALELLKFEFKPEQYIMVAPLDYDLRAAAKNLSKATYIHRTTEDPREDMEQVRECDIFISGTDGSKAWGLNALADMLRARNESELLSS
ncbi:hypothetical protein BT96DRAFT_1000193 [Gymnopus androsaceus JB14]|uniref:Uncharacterized protein n=1 Tax=Gymnopus androsaceus JB14 TaxID=1447944 RepID=A0A6A4H4E5_9AGAR|nr:hypothetical protein BT96DRAFT_1000193 [Gymnopus androsaceus JB14]